MRKVVRKRRKWRSPAKQKALLLLAAGATLGLKKQTLGGQLRLLEKISKEWEKIDRQHLYRLIREFKYERLVEYKENKDGTIRIVLSEAGQQKARQFDFDKLEIKKPAAWDKIWRLVIFDIPERCRTARRALREKLAELGFQELQKSVWIFPYPCEAEIEFIIEVFEIRRFVRLVEATKITNEADLLLKFNFKKS
jgi:DNA-binding transcriptional regulator PaaX